MNTDESLIAKSDERLSTADLAGTTEQTRGSHNENVRSHEQAIVVHHEGDLPAEPLSASPGAAAVRQQSTINKDMPAQPDAELQTRTGIFEEDEAQRFRSRWTEIQGDFVDDPRRAVREADALVADAMKRLTEVFANERRELEQQWGRGDNVTTEDLRLALRRYHAFFDRLLSV